MVAEIQTDAVEKARSTAWGLPGVCKETKYREQKFTVSRNMYIYNNRN